MEKKVDLGPIQKLIDDNSISEIMINGPKKVFVEQEGKKKPADIAFASDEDVIKLVENIFSASGKRVDKGNPYGDVCLEDGTRINAIIWPLALSGAAVTFRKFSGRVTTLEDLVQEGSLSQKAAGLLTACIRGKVNMIFSGGTGVGKTTLLRILARNFVPEERVVTIEDAAELKLEQNNIVALETRTPDADGKGGVTIRDLIRNSLRMSPDRLIIGEVRGGEAIDMLQAMATGHSGTIGIVHGNSPKDVLARLETMVLMSGVQLPLWEVRKLIASTINVIVHLERMQDGSRKVTYITELRGIEKDEIALNDLFTFRLEKIDENGKAIGSLRSAMRYYPLFFQKFKKAGLLADNIFVND